jgi:cyanophycinase
MGRIVPKGKLLLIGGAEDKGGDDRPDIEQFNKEFEHFEILKELLPENGHSERGIEIITTASKHPRDVEEMYEDAFYEIGFDNVDFMTIVNNEDARSERYIERIKDAHAVLFSGGEQFRLSTIIGNSKVWEEIYKKYMEDPDFILAGTSAGAMAMAEVMIMEGDNNEALLKGSVKITAGLGFIHHCIIDTHFIKRGRFGRLAEAIIMNPACIGIGLGEDTALIIYDGNEAECRGSGMVIIIDGKEIKHTNISYAEKETPVCAENLTVHILKKENGFFLREREFLPAHEDLEIERRIANSEDI